MPGIVLNGNHLTRWRGSVLAQLGDDTAMGELYDALSGIDTTFTRATAGMHCDLTKATVPRSTPGPAPGPPPRLSR